MVKRGVDTFIEYLDGIAAYGSNAGASRAACLHPVTALRWLSASREAENNNDESSVYYFEYAGKNDFLHNHRRMVEKSIVSDVLANAMVRARDGVTQPSMFQGHRVPTIDYDLLALGFTEAEAIMRDPVTGAIIFEQVYTPPSNELVLGILGGFTKRFARRLDVNHNHALRGGVEVVHSIEQQAHRRLDHKKTLPAVEVIDETVAEQVAEIATADKPGDVEVETDSAAAADATEVIAMADVADVDDVAADDAPTPAPVPIPAPAPRVSLTPLQQELLARARAKGLIE